jgi:hypothetical protein
VELNQLETLMSLPDAIMEPGILAVLRRYVSDGGNPATVVEMLSDNYHGVLINPTIPFTRIRYILTAVRQ